MSRFRMLLATAVVVAMAAGLVACGGDDDVETQTTTTTATGATISTPAPSSTTAVDGEVTLDCGTVGFTPASEDAASEIRATGVSCEEARTFVAAAGARTSSGGPQQVTVNGYRCVLTGSVDDPLPVADFECSDGDRKITFARS